MFHPPIDRSARALPSAFDRIPAGAAGPLRFPPAIDLCPEHGLAAADCDGLRLAAAVRRSASPQAFRPAFATGDWRVFSSFCIARELPPDHRVLVAGHADRTLRFLVEGSLWQQSAKPAGAPMALPPGTILGEDALFSDAPCALDVRTLERSLVLELPLARRKELTAACPEIGFELLRAAGAVIASRGRPATKREIAAA